MTARADLHHRCDTHGRVGCVPCLQAELAEPVTCPVRSHTGLYCELPGDDDHELHQAGNRTWATPVRTNHVREAQLLAGYLSGAAYDTLRRLDHATSLIEQAELVRAELVEKARAEGASWTKIGQQLGMTKQAAQQRYGTKPSPRIDPDQPTLV